VISRSEVLSQFSETGVVAVIRVKNPRDLVNTAQALLDGGVKCIEFTMTIPNALEIIRDASEKVSKNAVIGAGTVLDAETARLAILAGAQFVVSPIHNRSIVEICKRYGRVVIPGAFTPTEILTAWQDGGDIVKVFPASIGGPGYFKDLKGPFPDVEILPTGGVDIDTAPEFIKAGAIAVAVGKALVSPELILSSNYEQITANAQRFTSVIRNSREKNKSI